MSGFLANVLGSNIGDSVAKIIGLFKVDPNVAAQHAFELEKIQAELEGKLQDAMSKEIESASSNIRAEAGSGDKYTSRARPSFLYVMLAIFICNYILFPLFDRAPLQFPDALFWLFGSCMLGYTGARSWEKIGQNGKK